MYNQPETDLTQQHLELNEPLISFIIPALNEEHYITKTLDSLYAATQLLKIEIIVVDNGSTDNTICFSKKLDARVYIDANATIAGLRNLGAKHARAPFLTFIDADIFLDEDWGTTFINISSFWPDDYLYITGSSCLVSKNPSFIERYWFSKLKTNNKNYINSGHLIIPQKAFIKLGGFNDQLHTAEDFDLCQRAKQDNIKLFKESNLKAFHQGYPKTILQFFERESWHGKQDVATMSQFFHSKTALISVTNLVIIFLSAISLSLSLNTLGISFLFLSLVLVFIITRIKFEKNNIHITVISIALTYVYLFARVSSVIYHKRRPSARS